MTSSSQNTRFTDWNILSFVVFALGCLALLPFNVLIPWGAGTDFSYMQALNYIQSHHLPLSFGTGITYTYGPLGFLCYRVAVTGLQSALILLFQLYLYANFVWIFKSFLPVRSAISAAVVLLPLYFFGKEFGEATFYLVFLFSVFTFLKNGNLKYLINAVFISVLCFFIKVNFGLIQLFLLFIIICYALFNQKNSRMVLGAIAALALIAFFLLAHVLHVNLPAYLRISMAIVGGYSDAMVLPISIATKRYQIALIILIIYNLLSILYWFKEGLKFENLLRWLLVSLYTFIVFKYAFTRAEIDRVPHSFFIFAVAGLAIQYLFEHDDYRARLKDLALACFFMAGTVYFANNQFIGKPQIKAGLSTEYFSDLAGGMRHKLDFSDDIKAPRLFPDSILKKIGNGTVDLMPYNLSLIFANKLNYCPRPALQSFMTYIPQLDSLNCEKYSSEQAPQFVIYSCSSNDERNPIWDEPATKRALCQYYMVVDSFNIDDGYCNGYDRNDPDIEQYLLLQKRPTPLVAHVTPQTSGELRTGAAFIPDTGAIPQYLFIDFEYTLAGKLKSLLFQPSLMYEVVTYPSGNIEKFRAIRGIVPSGVLVNKEVTSNDGAQLLFNTNGSGNHKISSIRFEPADGYSFKPVMHYHTQLISYTDK